MKCRRLFTFSSFRRLCNSVTIRGQIKLPQ